MYNLQRNSTLLVAESIICLGSLFLIGTYLSHEKSVAMFSATARHLALTIAQATVAIVFLGIYTFRLFATQFKTPVKVSWLIYCLLLMLNIVVHIDLWLNIHGQSSALLASLYYIIWGCFLLCGLLSKNQHLPDDKSKRFT